jgi:hypothetical protein
MDQWLCHRIPLTPHRRSQWCPFCLLVVWRSSADTAAPQPLRPPGLVTHVLQRRIPAIASGSFNPAASIVGNAEGPSACHSPAAPDNSCRCGNCLHYRTCGPAAGILCHGGMVTSARRLAASVSPTGCGLADCVHGCNGQVAAQDPPGFRVRSHSEYCHCCTRGCA